MLRLTGGEFRGRSIKTPKNDLTRPTQARLRQALFNSIQAHIGDAKVADLFAGSGALGLEALSRGASSVIFVEQSRQNAALIEQNIQDFKVGERSKVFVESVDRVSGALMKQGPFDLVFADPPYELGWELRLLNELPWGELLVPGGLLCLEWGIQKSQVSELPEQTPLLVKIREKNYGDSMLSTFERSV